MPRRMLPRKRLTDYITLEGLHRLTGVKPEDFDRLMLKELIDNALDACDETAEQQIPTVQVAIEKTDRFVKFSVEDNASGIDDEGIRKITDFTTLYSSRFHYKYPTRGALGNAWKYILGMGYALASTMKAKYIPVVILTNNTRYKVHIHHENGQVKAKVKPSKADRNVGTTVIISLPLYRDFWGEISRYLFDLQAFAYFNPQANIIFNINHKEVKYGDLDRNYQPLKNLRESPWWHSINGFTQRVQAEAEDHLGRGEHPLTSSFISEFRGISRKQARARVLGQCGIGNPPLEELADNTEDIAKLFEAMRNGSRPPNPHVLKRIGRKMFYWRIYQIDGLLDCNREKLEDPSKNRYYKYKSTATVQSIYAGEAEILVPFIVEVAVAVNKIRCRRIHIGVNRSCKLEDPFAGRVFFEDPKVYAGIKGILQKNGIGPRDGVTVLVHITCPNIQYSDPGKIHMNIDPFHDAIKETVDRASRFYKRKKSHIQLVRKANGQNDNVPSYQNEATFKVLPEAIQHVSSNGRFRYKQRQLWYVVREFLDKRGWSKFCPAYKNYFPSVLDQYQKEKGVKLEGLLLEANSELQEPRSNTVVPLSTEGEESYRIPEWKYNKILYVEKRGFKDVIIANRFHEKYDIAVIGAQGEPSKAVRRLFKRIEKVTSERKEKIEIFCIHDADLWGCEIHLTLSKPSKRMPSHLVHVTDLGLGMLEALKLGLQPEKQRLKKPRRISKKGLRHVPQEELLAFIGSKDVRQLYEPIKETFRVELNAFTPQQFLNWLNDKLEKHGIKEKVRPPNKVVAKETCDKIDESLEENVKEFIFQLCGGQEVVDELKSTISNEERLDEVDLSQQMDATLKTFPLGGWREIMKKKVDSLVDSVFEKKWIEDEIYGAIVKCLETRNKTGKNS